MKSIEQSAPVGIGARRMAHLSGRAWARMLGIEARRTVAIPFAPLLVGLTWYGLRYDLSWELWHWAQTSALIGRTALLTVPFGAGVAAWMAGRRGRRGIDDLLATTPQPAFAREAATWAATTAWGLLAYAAIGAFLAGVTVARGTWGRPDPWPILAGALATVAGGALGYALGAAFPRRFTAPLVAVGLFVGENLLLESNRLHPALRAVTYLSPATNPGGDIWYGVLPPVAPWRALFYAGLTALCLALLAWGLDGWRRGRATVATLLAAALALGGAAGTVAHTPRSNEAWLAMLATTPMQPYTPVCSADPIPVCVHPAYRPWLAALSRDANAVLAPLVGLPGMPSRAEQMVPGHPWPDDILPFPALSQDIVAQGTSAIVRSALFAQPPGSGPHRFTAQDALQIWLYDRSGITPPYAPWRCSRYPDSPGCAAARFGRLSPDEQHAWLAAHFAAVRAGTVPLEALP